MTVFRSYRHIEANRAEIFRYAGVKEPDEALSALTDTLLAEAEMGFTYGVVYREFPLCPAEGGLNLGFAFTDSRQLCRLLAGCGSLVLFAATVGFGIDRMTEKYQRLAPARAVLANAVGADRIENLCNRFCGELREEYEREGKTLTPRFSPGYGDFPLTVQRDIMAALECEKRLGVVLDGGLLMSPSKSVTALCGIKKKQA